MATTVLAESASSASAFPRTTRNGSISGPKRTSSHFAQDYPRNLPLQTVVPTICSMSLRALLFCPDEKTAKIVTQVLGEVDFSVEQASEPFAAVKKLSSQPFDALVVDCANEQDAGLLMKSARNSSSNQGSLIVALVEGQIGVANAFRIGANLVLTKPVAVEQAKSTLRVARGLLRKGGDAMAVPPSPSRPSAPPASTPTATSRPVPAATPTAVPRTMPVPPPQALPVVAPAAAMTSNLEVEAEQAPAPDEAEAGLLESMTSASTSYAAAPAPATAATSARTDFRKPAAPQFHPAPEMPGRGLTTFDAPIQTSASSHIVEPAVPVHAPDASAAAAPARALSAPAAKVVPTREHDGSQSGTGDPVVYPDFPDLHPKEEVETSRKAPLVAVAAILFVAVAFYFGWSALRSGKAGQKPAGTPVNSTAPVFPSEPAAPTPTPTPTSSAPAKSAPTPETITKFVVPATEVAPNTVTKSQSNDSGTSLVTGKAPLQVRSGKRLDHEAGAGDIPDAGPAPSLGAVTSGESGNELSTLVASTPATLPSAAPEAVRISQGVSQGLLLKRVQPVYPSQARQARIEGTVELLATIGKDGSIKDVKVVSGPPILGKVAVDAIRQWKYKPYYLNGDPVEVQTQIALNFKLPN